MCRRCAVMRTQEKNKFCTTVRRPCISRTNLFQQPIIDAIVLELAVRYREDVLVLKNVRNNKNFRHAAYRQYVLWQHGKLERGNRRVVPNCCVLAIRARYPLPNLVFYFVQHQTILLVSVESLVILGIYYSLLVINSVSFHSIIVIVNMECLGYKGLTFTEFVTVSFILIQINEGNKFMSREFNNTLQYLYDGQ